MRSLRILVTFAALLALSCSSWKRFAYEGFDRDSWQHPDAVVAALDIAPGDHVADLGAGGGYFTFRLAEAVGPGGRVYAVDVDEDMTAHLARRASDEGHDNVEVILGEFEDPQLPDGRVDLLFTCNTFHHLEERAAYFERVRRDLRPGGRVAIIDLNGSSWFSRTFDHYTPKQVIIDEMKAAGYRVEREVDVNDRQNFVIFATDGG